MCSPSWRDPPTRLAWQPRTVYTAPVDQHNRDVELNREVAMQRRDHRLNSPCPMRPPAPRLLLHHSCLSAGTRPGVRSAKTKTCGKLRHARMAAPPLSRLWTGRYLRSIPVPEVRSTKPKTCGKLRYAQMIGWSQPDQTQNLRQTAACPLVRSMPARTAAGGEIRHNETCGILGHARSFAPLSPTAVRYHPSPGVRGAGGEVCPLPPIGVRLASHPATAPARPSAHHGVAAAKDARSQ